MTSAAGSGLVRRLTTLQHLLFAGLLIICVVRAWQHGANRPALTGGALLLLGWYAAGAIRAGHSPAAAGRPRVPAPTLWLLGLSGLWVALVWLSPDLVWLGFALWLLSAHLLALVPAAIFSAAVLGVVIGAPALAGQPWTVAGVLGPAVGALFAVALARGQLLLARESAERARLLDSLVAAHAQTSLLHEQLLAAQREAGAAAERTRLSRDIHDTLAQGFSSILLLARGQSQAADTAQLGTALARIESAAAAGLDEARNVVAALAPADLSDGGLGAALRRLLDELHTDTGIATRLNADPQSSSLPMATEVALLRVAQGALANVRQHSAASRVVVSLSSAGGQVRLDVVDDGRGFEAGDLPSGVRDIRNGGYGLTSTRARLSELGGGLEIESTPGEGAAVSAFLPAPEKGWRTA